jgi:hypothetical protein
MGFWDNITGKSAANAAEAAARDTFNKQNAATAGISQYGDQHAAEFRSLGQSYNPYTQAGSSAINRLMAGLGLGGPDSSQQFTDAYRSLPGYQAGIDTGSRAITGNAAARGMLNSGATLKGLQRFGSDYEDKRATDYLSRLMGLSQQGVGATTAQNATIGQGLQGQLGARQSAYQGSMQAAGTLGQGQIAGANAQAAGSQNLFNTGANIFGKLLGMSGGGGGGGGGYLGSSFQHGQNIPTFY